MRSIINQFRNLEGGAMTRAQRRAAAQQKQMSQQEQVDRVASRRANWNRSRPQPVKAPVVIQQPKPAIRIMERPVDKPSVMEQMRTDPKALENAIRTHALNMKVAKQYNNRKIRDLKRELKKSSNPKVIAKQFYTIDKVNVGGRDVDVGVTMAHVNMPFSMQPVIASHPGDKWFNDVTVETAKEDNEEYEVYIGEDAAQDPMNTQRFWVAVKEREYENMLDSAKSEKEMNRVMYLNMMAVENDDQGRPLLRHVRAPLIDGSGRPVKDSQGRTKHVRLVRGDFLKRFREEKKDELKLSDAEKEIHSLRALNDRMEKILMVTTQKRQATQNKAASITSNMDAKTKKQFDELTEAFNHPLKMGSLFKPFPVTIGSGNDEETKMFCDILHEFHEKNKEKHGDVNTTSSAYQQFGDREKKTGKYHRALLADGICVSPEVKGPGGKPFAMEVAPETYHHLDKTNALTQKINARLDPSGTRFDKQKREEEVWADMVFCARASDDEDECNAPNAKYPLSAKTMNREQRCEFTQLQRRVTKDMLNPEKMPATLERGAKVEAKIDLGPERGHSIRYYKAIVKRVRKDMRGNMTFDLKFDYDITNLSHRQRKMIPGRCQPKFVDADESTEASDLYHDEFYSAEQKYVKKKKTPKNLDGMDAESMIRPIVEMFKKLEEKQAQKKEKEAKPFDSMDGSAPGNIDGYHRV